VTAAAAERRHRRDDVSRYQNEVEALLEQIRGHVRELRRLKVAGARAQALAERKSELRRARATLAALVGERVAR
jgi:hypothetical protein